jgi:hypothetical protein
MRPQRRAISKRARADIESAPTSSVCPYFVSRAKDRELFLKERVILTLSFFIFVNIKTN